MNLTDFKRSLTGQLLSNIGLEPNESKSLLWPNNYAHGKEGFIKLFSLNPNDVVYRIATEGIGNEKDKVNSVLSSALLSLLVFNPLFGYPNEKGSKSISIRLPGEEKLREFDNCFFEVRNTVIGFPSCVDVVLTSKEGGHTTLLFLESKFIEYLEDLKEIKEYGKSYNSLYLKDGIKNALDCGSLNIESSLGSEKMKLSSKQKRYIEGIKQTISHLIGIVKGPSCSKKGFYPDKYAESYKRFYHSEDAEFIYGTILYQTPTKGYSDYRDLYRKIIGDNGTQIVSAINEWNKSSNKTIKVLPDVLTYQQVFGLLENKGFLPSVVNKFYGLDEAVHL